MTVQAWILGLWDTICDAFKDDNQRPMTLADLGRLAQVIASYASKTEVK